LEEKPASSFDETEETLREKARSRGRKEGQVWLNTNLKPQGWGVPEQCTGQTIGGWVEDESNSGGETDYVPKFEKGNIHQKG